MGLIGDLIKGYQKNKIEDYISNNSMEDAFEKYGVEKLVKTGVLKAIPNSSYFYRKNVVYDRFGAVFNYYTHFANGNMVIYEDFEHYKDHTVERNYSVIDGSGVKKTKWHNNIICGADFMVLTNTAYKIDRTNKAIIINPVGQIIETDYDVLCRPSVADDDTKIFETRNIARKGSIVIGKASIDHFCNIEDLSCVDTTKVG